MTNTAFSVQPIINSTLNTKNVELVSLYEGADAIYFASDYGDATNLTQENLDALLKDEDAFVEREMEEGAVLLRNENKMCIRDRFLPTPIGIMSMKCTPDQYKRLMQERSAANRGER